MLTKKETKFYDAGEVGPYLSMSVNSLSRVMKAIIKTKATLHSTFCLDVHCSRASVVYRIEVEAGKESLFEQIAKCKLTQPPTVYLG